MSDWRAQGSAQRRRSGAPRSHLAGALSTAENFGLGVVPVDERGGGGGGDGHDDCGCGGDCCQDKEGH